MSRHAVGTQPTDWDIYYRQSPGFSRLTRPLIAKRLVRALDRYSVPRPRLAELGGANSCVLDPVLKSIAPTEYHIIDSNQYGLDLLRGRTEKDKLFLHKQDVLRLSIDVQLDTVFSLGLIEHFDPEGTRHAIEAHLELLKPGGVAVITFPTPTPLYRLTRSAAELAGKWIFHDERPLRTAEILGYLDGKGKILHEELIWPIFLTQTLLVIRKD